MTAGNDTLWLQELHLDGNQLSGTLPASLSEQLLLTVLHLGRNNFRWQLLAKIFCQAGFHVAWGPLHACLPPALQWPSSR